MINRNLSLALDCTLMMHECYKKYYQKNVQNHDVQSTYGSASYDWYTCCLQYRRININLYMFRIDVKDQIEEGLCQKAEYKKLESQGMQQERMESTLGAGQDPPRVVEPHLMMMTLDNHSVKQLVTKLLMLMFRNCKVEINKIGSK